MMTGIPANRIAQKESNKLLGMGDQLSGRVIGQVFSLFVLTIAAAEVGVGLAIVLLIYRNSHSADLDDVHALKG